MTEMNPETLPFDNKGSEKNKISSDSGKIAESIVGSSALKLEPDILENISEEQNRDAQIGEIEKSIRPKNILPFTNTDAGVQRAPRGVVGPVGNQGREASGGDRTGGEKKKGRGIRLFAGALAGVTAVGGMAYGLFKDKIDSFFGGGVDPNGLPPTYSAGASGEMPSQSIDPVTPNAEVTTTPEAVTPEVTEAPTPTLDQTEILAQKKQNFINKTGEYTYENIKNKLFVTGSPSEKLNKTYDLGVVQFAEGVNETQILVQGWLYNYREEDGNLILEVGFDSKDGSKRIYKDVVVPTDFYQKYPNIRNGLYFIDYQYYQMADSDLTNLGSKSDIESIENQLNSFIDEPMIFTFYSRYVISDGEKNVLGEETALAYGDLLNNNSSALNLLLSEISDNGEDVKIGDIDNTGSSKLILTDVRACFEKK